MRRAVGVAFHGDGWYGDDGRLRELLLEFVELRIAFGKCLPPAIIVDDDRDMVGIVEGRRAAGEGGVVEMPLRRGELPDQPVELVAVLLIAGAAALGGEIELVPPLQFRAWRQRDLAR